MNRTIGPVPWLPHGWPAQPAQAAEAQTAAATPALRTSLPVNRDKGRTARTAPLARFSCCRLLATKEPTPAADTDGNDCAATAAVAPSRRLATEEDECTNCPSESQCCCSLLTWVR